MAGKQDGEPGETGVKVTDRRHAGRDEEPEQPAPPEARGTPPPIDFTTFILSLASTAFIHLGIAPDPDTGKASPPNVLLARETIDLLGMLREKTRGNLTADEQKFFDALLYDLRVRFVEAARTA